VCQRQGGSSCGRGCSNRSWSLELGLFCGATWWMTSSVKPTEDRWESRPTESEVGESQVRYTVENHEETRVNEVSCTVEKSGVHHVGTEQLAR
jgi:hypothetical protein